jgi:hypothetical protein
MHIALAPFELKPGITEDDLVSASDRFEAEFARKQDGVVRRNLVKDGDGGYADLVCFRDLDAMNRVIEAERSSEACAAFFSIMTGDGSHRVYEVLKSYE